MQANALPYAVQLRELHRQELYAEADHERLVRQATTMPRHHEQILSALRTLLTAVWSQVVGQRDQPAPVAAGAPPATAMRPEMVSR